MDKKIGIEIENIAISKDFPEDLIGKNISSKYAIFRPYSNNNPIVARIIGKLIGDVFYILYIDIGGNLYKQ